jgi:hypothetical protein
MGANFNDLSKALAATASSALLAIFVLIRSAAAMALSSVRYIIHY